jgi:hypothetical protein
VRAEYSELNNSKMIEIALPPLTYLNLIPAGEIDRDDESAVSKRNDDVIGCNFESRSMGGTPICHRFDQVLKSINMECSRLSARREGLVKEGIFRLDSTIDDNSIGVSLSKVNC